MQIQSLPSRRFLGSAFAGLLLASVAIGAAPAPDARAVRFESLFERIHRDVRAARETEMIELLELAEAIGRPYPASMAVKQYLTQHADASPALLLRSARNAEAAGDLRTAVSRYKNYLKQAAPGVEASRAAADLVELSLDYLRITDDVYRFMTENLGRFREDPAYRRFDRWYAGAARSRNDCAEHARLLALVFKEKLPIEEERLYFWDELDWLIKTMSIPGPKQQQALDAFESLGPLIRDDARRQAEVGFHAALVRFAATGKVAAADVRARHFDAVAVAAGRAFDAAPGLQSLRGICLGFGGGADAFSATLCREDWEQKGDVIVRAFARLSDADRTRFVEWVHNGSTIATLAAPPSKWSAAARAVPAWFKDNTLAGTLAYGGVYKDKAAYVADAAALPGVPSRSAALIRGMAAAADAKGVVDHLFAGETWHLGFADLLPMVSVDVPAAWRGLGGAADWDAVRDELLTHALEKHACASPVAIFDPDNLREALRGAWRHYSARDARGGIVPLVESLAWVPWSSKTRRAVIEPVYGDFRHWADGVRKGADEATVRQIGAIDAAFRDALGRVAPALDRAPAGVCALLAKATVAEDAGDKDSLGAAMKDLYMAVREYPAQKPPYATALLRFIMQRRERVDMFDVQVVFLRAQLLDWAPDGPNVRARLMLEALRESNRWEWSRIPQHERSKAKALNAAFAEGLTKLLDKQAFSMELYDLVRGTRGGHRWSDADANADLFERLIKEQTLIKHDIAGSAQRNSAISYMHLVRFEIPSLSGRYPYDRYFDDLYVTEARAKQHLDAGCWNYSGDASRKIAGVAAEVLKGCTVLPLGYGNDKRPSYTRDELSQWHARALESGAATRDPLLAACEAAYGKTRFDPYAMGLGFFATQARGKTPADRTAFIDKLEAYVTRAAAARERVALPNLKAVLEMADAPLSPREFGVLHAIFENALPEIWTANASQSALVYAVERALVGSEREPELHRLVRHFWKVCRDTGDADLERHLVRQAQVFADEGRYHLAIAYGFSGTEVMAGRLAEASRATLQAAKSKALAKVANEVPLDRADPRYPVFAAQVAYFTGKEQDAWEGIRAHRSQVESMVKSLDPSFCTWIVERCTELKQFEDAEALARVMILWMDENPKGFDPEIRAGLYVAHAGIAFGQQEYPKARAQYERIAATADFADTQAQRKALLRIAEVDRQTRNYDAAIEGLEKLARRDDDDLRKGANYLLAVVKYDQEDYPEAMAYLNKVFALDPASSDGRILEGKVFLKLKKLMEATDVKVGHLASQRFLVPGSPLRVKLDDPNLTIVRRSADVEIVAWTKSGDRETFNLLPFGDALTRFEGSLPTALAPMKPNDGALQVLGDDLIYYDFSDAFKTANKITVSARNEIAVMTDPDLYVSSGRIVSREEDEQLALERMIRDRLELDTPSATTDMALSTVRQSDQIKPGNPINVRVVDPDRSLTAGIDTLTVAVAAASGDSIPAFVLNETGTHSGVFEGAVPTAPSEAVAYATDSDEGSDPCFAISGGDHPPWVALPDNSRPKIFTFDVHDNIHPAAMKIVSDVPGRHLKRLLLQTSLNGKVFESAGSLPAAFLSWDGSPRIEIARYGQYVAAPQSVTALREFLDAGFLTAGEQLHYGKHASFSVAWDENVDGFAQKMNLARDGAGSWYVARLSGGFYTAVREVRTFELVTIRGDAGMVALFTIDGEGPPVGQRRDGAPKMAITRAFKKGVHRIDVYICATRRAQPAVELRCDTTEPPYMIPCPPALFDVAAQPLIGEALATRPATFTVNEAGTTIDVGFDATAARARVFKLTILDYETDAPAIDRIELTDREGRQVLPTKQDLLALRTNARLETVPGDVITVTYKDPKFVTKSRESLSARLNATFHNADVSVSFVEIGYGGGERRESYIPLRRYEPGDALTVFVRDPDMDVSAETDKVVLSLQTSAVGSKPVSIEAIETAPHSGVFTKRIFPVLGAAKREAEVAVAEGDDLVIGYMDDENTDPGIPWKRSFVCEQVWYQEPELRVYNVESLPLTADAKSAPSGAVEAGERFLPTRSMVVKRPSLVTNDAPATILIDGPLVAEVVFPTIAKSPRSTADIYVQTLSALKRHRAAAGTADAAVERPTAIDITVPGTIKRTVAPSGVGAFPPPAGYGDVLVVAERKAGSPLDEGQFSVVLPLVLGPAPDRSMVDEKASSGEPPPLVVQGGDTLVVGFRYIDDRGGTNWMTRLAAVRGDVFFDVMDRAYAVPLTHAYVGETLYLRVLDRLADRTDEKDEVVVVAKASSGASETVRLVETRLHSGIFQGYAKLTYASGGVASAGPNAFAVKYGDALTLSYGAEAERGVVVHEVLVHRGADGDVLPFTRRFNDPEIAVQTQFTLAESYFELAKRHRDMGEDDMARQKIAQGKKMLEEALRDFPNTEARVQADYLLGNLAFEFAKDSADAGVQRQYQLEAISRFTSIVAKYGDTEYAPKAQFKKGIVYEKMGELEKAAEEYVKLSYRYPDNELVAETIARLGQYFLVKGKAVMARMEGVEDAVEREKIRMEAVDVFKTSGEVFGRLGQRFPQHKLAGQTGLLSGQCFMRAELYPEAVEAFNLVIAKADAYEPAVISETMFWCGEAHAKNEALLEAYKMYTRLRWDYPDTKWAKHARGRLAQAEFAKIDVQ